MHGSSVMAKATFRLSPDLKVRADNLARKTNRSSSYLYISWCLIILMSLKIFAIVLQS